MYSILLIFLVLFLLLRKSKQAHFGFSSCFRAVLWWRYGTVVYYATINSASSICSFLEKCLSNPKGSFLYDLLIRLSYKAMLINLACQQHKPFAVCFLVSCREGTSRVVKCGCCWCRRYHKNEYRLFPQSKMWKKFWVWLHLCNSFFGSNFKFLKSCFINATQFTFLLKWIILR